MPHRLRIRDTMPCPGDLDHYIGRTLEYSSRVEFKSPRETKQHVPKMHPTSFQNISCMSSNVGAWSCRCNGLAAAHTHTAATHRALPWRCLLSRRQKQSAESSLLGHPTPQHQAASIYTGAAFLFKIPVIWESFPFNNLFHSIIPIIW